MSCWRRTRRCFHVLRRHSRVGLMLTLLAGGLLAAGLERRRRPQAHAHAGVGAGTSAGAAREQLAVGFLPVTCHLTCPVTDFATKASATTRFEAQRFTDFPTVVDSIRAGRLRASFLIAPLAM